ncbi:rod shape-determining protein MreC [Colwellia sp. Arc7-D]|uniref:rod shape-determining protein MreC n=1 Tax=Colwellia sp. Arc7-D TaxID=2161872 RepID=UPI000D371880|nr:rod shape-determining protein MreC [Colwellia sp. Arc7-D]AWB58977.1 rod shape-determining protein MreC [Colwellia sp. Arc7-D]|tara:strand:- start:4515 stop:5396 length:882 start_codon:yes stop_codon:yes gene_type:complete
MNPIFKHGPSPQHRLILVLLCSAALIFFDHKMNSFESARGFLQSMVSPLQYLATAPKQMMNWAAENIVTRRQLIDDNEQYKINELVFHEQALQLDIVKRENNRLRALLASPVRSDAKKMVAEILAVDSDPYTHQVVINRGANDGVYEGQAVIDDEGVVGQILHVGTTSSRVLLITDVTHAVPVRISRNGLRLIASGVGVIDRLTHNHVPHSSDIRIGDILVTSGLGSKFPEGYPVAKVSAVIQDESRAFSQIQSQPVAKIDRLRYVLLLWPEQPNEQQPQVTESLPDKKAENK